MSLEPPAPNQFDKALREHLEATWREGIPLADFMNISLESLDATGLHLYIPLATSRNHMGTGFAGALQASMTLAGWGLASALLHRERAHDLVAQSSKINFLLPVRESFQASAPMPDAAAVEQFITQFRQRGKARLKLRVRATVNGDFHATGEVQYAALAR